MTLITHLGRRRQIFEMAELQRSLSDQGNSNTNSANASFRSRASSVISTGTKFSISTLPQVHFLVDGMLDANVSRRSTPRPGSPFSMRSIATSLPPYEGHQPMEGHFFYGNGDSQLTAHQNPSTINDDQTVVNNHSQPTTPTDPENTLSMHYGRIVRTIDDNHARQLTRIRSAHEQELAATRDAIDQAYRKEWKIKNREIERIREEAAKEVEQTRRDSSAEVTAVQEELQRLSADHDDAIARIQRENAEKLVSLYAEHQAAIEKARHAIEDLWEGRWHDRTRIAADEARRIALEMEGRDAKRDEEWFQTIAERCPHMLDEIKSAIMKSRAHSKYVNTQADVAA